MFLCAIRDGHSRKVLGHSISDHIRAEMVTTAIDATETELVAAVDKWVRFYGVRRHSSIGMVSPEVCEKSLPAAA